MFAKNLRIFAFFFPRPAYTSTPAKMNCQRYITSVKIENSDKILRKFFSNYTRREFFVLFLIVRGALLGWSIMSVT